MGVAAAVVDGFILWMVRLRSKSGLSADDARRVFDEYHSRRQQEPEPPGATGDRRLLEQILDYMESTSAKLDKIEQDITDLRHQVDSILRRL